MDTLTPAVLSRLQNPPPAGPVPASLRVVQFGEGNFLRAFADWMLDIGNERLGLDAGVAVVQPIAQGLTAQLAEQGGLYTVLLRGRQGGQDVQEARIVSAIRQVNNPYEDFEAFLALARGEELRFVISNTTEAGIAYTGQDALTDAPQASFPGKLTRFLYERYTFFQGAPDKGLVLLPCELIDRNAEELLSCVERTARGWGLEPGFLEWIAQHNAFCPTLVDRIVTGYPHDQAEALWEGLGYRDDLLDVGEPFALWVIQAPDFVRRALPLDRAGLPVVYTDDVTPYKQRKVRLLNGAHSWMVPGAFLSGRDTVAQCMADPVIRPLLERTLYQEIIPTLDLPEPDLKNFAASVLERFENPYNQHRLLSIALNSVSKYRARVLPSILEYVRRFGALPPLLTYSMAALIMFYRGKLSEHDGVMVGNRGGVAYPVTDDPQVLRFFLSHNTAAPLPLVRSVLGNRDFWGQDLNRIPDFDRAVTDQLQRIEGLGAYRALEAML